MAIVYMGVKVISTKNNIAALCTTLKLTNNDIELDGETKITE
jgi:hypothetical protein